MFKKILFIIIPIAILVAIFYFLFFRETPKFMLPGGGNSTTPAPNTFNPFNRGGVVPPRTTTQGTTTDEVGTQNTGTQKTLSLRQITTTPVGGFMASTTASSTLVRFIDRGVGHISEARDMNDVITKISNTTIPKIYESYWNKNVNVAILRYLKDDTDTITNFYAEIRPIKVSTSTNSNSNPGDFIPNEVKGKYLSANILGIAVSPKRDRIFTLNNENGKSVGYISGFDESKRTKIFKIPLAQVTIDWPEENTLTILSKASGVSSGYFYAFDIKKGALTKVLGGIIGLDAKMSADAKKVIFSVSRDNGVSANIYSLKDGATEQSLLKTLPQKCVWSKLNPQDLYCAVPTKFDSFLYPDDWYKGNTSFIDQIWHLDTTTGEVHLVANPLSISNVLIDATDLTLDPKEHFLYFTNKRDLTLWSLDLTK